MGTVVTTELIAEMAEKKWKNPPQNRAKKWPKKSGKTRHKIERKSQQFSPLITVQITERVYDKRRTSQLPRLHGPSATFRHVFTVVDTYVPRNTSIGQPTASSASSHDQQPYTTTPTTAPTFQHYGRTLHRKHRRYVNTTPLHCGHHAHDNMPAKDKRRVPQPTRRRKVSRTSTSTDTALPSTGATAATAAADAEVVEVDEDASGKMMCSNCGAIFTRDYLGPQGLLVI